MTRCKSPRFNDPTRTGIFYYLETHEDDLLKDYNALADRCGWSRIGSHDLREIESSGPAGTVVRAEPPLCHLRKMMDTWILLIACSAGDQTSDPALGWQVGEVFPWDSINRSFRHSTLFSVDSSHCSPEVARSLKLPLQIAVDAMAFGAQGECGYIQLLSPHVFLFLANAEKRNVSGDFQISTLPLLEMQRHKAEFYDGELDKDSKLVIRATEATIRRLNLGSTPSLLTAHTDTARRLSSRVAVSLNEMRIKAGNVRKARDNFTDVWEESVQHLLRGRLKDALYRRLNCAVENAEHACETAETAHRNLVILLENHHGLSIEKSRPDPFDHLFPTGHSLYADLKEKKLIWQRVVDSLRGFAAAPQMALHEWVHVEHVYRIVGVLAGELREAGLVLNAAELFIVAAAALLHDVGMSCRMMEDDYGRSFYIERDSDVRKLHCRLSKYAIEVSLREVLRLDWAREPVAYLALYHQRKAPLSGGSPWKEQLPGTDIVSTVFPVSQKKVYRASDKQNYTVRLELLAALLRFCDALDVDCDRAGDEYENEVIQKQVEGETKCLLPWLRSEGVSLDADLEHQIRDPWHASSPRDIKSRLNTQADEYRDLSANEHDSLEKSRFEDISHKLEYLAYLCEQAEHFRKHQCFDEVQIAVKMEGGKRLLILGYPVLVQDAELVTYAKGLLAEDLHEEFDSVKSIYPFNELHDVRIEFIENGDN